MTHRATITLDEEAFNFLQATAGKNRGETQLKASPLFGFEKVGDAES